VKRRVSTEVLFRNSWHRYQLDRFRLKDGSIGEYYHIDMAGACGTIPLFEDGTTALLKVYRYLLDTTLWEFPIGGMQPGEDPLEVARKELREEAGIRADRWDLLGRVAPYKGVSNEVDFFYLARDLTMTEQELEVSEEITVHRMPLERAREVLLDQPLVDGQSIAGLALLDRFLDS
jgi:ADP-ribose pyrophosphatase